MFNNETLPADLDESPITHPQAGVRDRIVWALELACLCLPLKPRFSHF